MKKCKILKIISNFDDGSIPDWYKNENDYKDIIKYLNKKYIKDIKTFIPKVSNIKLSINLNKLPKKSYIFYWAAKSINKIKIDNEDKAYDKLQNSGIVKTNNNGSCKIILNCPQIYSHNDITYPRHIHFTYLKNNKLNKWNKNIKTIIINCLISNKKLNNILLKKNMIVFNSDSKKIYNKKHIPNSLNLSYKLLIKHTDKEKIDIINKKILKYLKYYPKIKKLYDNNRIKLNNIPIVIYSNEPKENNKLYEILYKLKFYNILEYPFSYQYWKNISNDNKLFNLNYNYETLIFNNTQYNHNINTNELYINNNFIGLWDNNKINYKKKNKVKNNITNNYLKKNNQDIKKYLNKLSSNNNNKNNKKKQYSFIKDNIIDNLKNNPNITFN